MLEWSVREACSSFSSYPSLALESLAKQNLALKFLKAQSWNKKLAGFVETFETRRTELQLALQLHEAAAVNEMAAK